VSVAKSFFLKRESFINIQESYIEVIQLSPVANSGTTEIGFSYYESSQNLAPCEFTVSEHVFLQLDSDLFLLRKFFSKHSNHQSSVNQNLRVCTRFGLKSKEVFG
jgi:hypothetical protein